MQIGTGRGSVPGIPDADQYQEYWTRISTGSSGRESVPGVLDTDQYQGYRIRTGTLTPNPNLNLVQDADQYQNQIST